MQKWKSVLKREVKGMWSRVIWVHPWRKPEVKDVKWMTYSKHFSLKWGSVDKGLSAIRAFFHALMFEYNLNSGHSTGFWTIPMLSRKFIVLWLMSWPYLAYRHTKWQGKSVEKVSQLSADFKMATVINFEMLKGSTVCEAAVH